MKKNELTETMQMFIENILSNTHTSTIAKVTQVKATTINCQPVINRVVNGQSIKLPEFVDVPPVFPCGGDSYIAYPIKKDDYVLLTFTERCFDAWYNGQDFVSPPQLRMHDYSDAFAVVGLKPMRQAITIPDVTTEVGDRIQQGNYTQTGDLERTGDTTLNGDFTQTGNFELTGNMTINGNLTINGNISFTGTLSIDGENGASGVFVSQDGKTVTVTGGIITSIL